MLVRRELQYLITSLERIYLQPGMYRALAGTVSSIVTVGCTPDTEQLLDMVGALVPPCLQQRGFRLIGQLDEHGAPMPQYVRGARLHASSRLAEYPEEDGIAGFGQTILAYCATRQACGDAAGVEGVATCGCASCCCAPNSPPPLAAWPVRRPPAVLSSVVPPPPAASSPTPHVGALVSAVAPPLYLPPPSAAMLAAPSDTPPLAVVLAAALCIGMLLMALLVWCCRRAPSLLEWMVIAAIDDGTEPATRSRAPLPIEPPYD